MVHVESTTEPCPCEWERQPQAFRWFPELGSPLDPSGAVETGRTTNPADLAQPLRAAG